jgi:hypothetical protein
MILRAEIAPGRGLAPADDAWQSDALARNGAFCLTNAQLWAVEQTERFTTRPARIARVSARLVIISVVAVAVLLAPGSASAKRCGRVYIPAVKLRAKVRVVVGPDSCGAAKRLIGTAFEAEDKRSPGSFDRDWAQIWQVSVSGWNCSAGLAGSQTYCRRGRRRVDGSFRTDDGWSF